MWDFAMEVRAMWPFNGLFGAGKREAVAPPAKSAVTETTSADAEGAAHHEQSVLAAAAVGYLTTDYALIANRQAAQSMTREVWGSSSDPLAMLCFLHGRTSGRKFRLFAVACARDEFAHGTISEGECPADRLPAYLVEIEGVEAFADGGPRPEPWARHWASQPACSSEDVAHAALGFNADVGLWMKPIEETVPKFLALYRTHPAHYIRDIFGNVFHQVPLAEASRTATVLAIARAAYEERELPLGRLRHDHLAVLADALEDTGCRDEDLLAHLRSPGPHVRGCWALDLVLGRE